MNEFHMSFIQIKLHMLCHVGNKLTKTRLFSGTVKAYFFFEGALLKKLRRPTSNGLQSYTLVLVSVAEKKMQHVEYVHADFSRQETPI